MRKFRVIYVPGLGDSFDSARRTALWLWKLWGVQVTLVPMRWNTSETYEDKYLRLIGEIKKHNHVIIIGESAGAAMALRATNEMNSVKHCITLCGVCRPTAHIGDGYSNRAPALRQATKNIPHEHKKAKNITSFYSPFDVTVIPKNAVAHTAKRQKIYLPGHMTAIGYGLLVYIPWFLRRFK